MLISRVCKWLRSHKNHCLFFFKCAYYFDSFMPGVGGGAQHAFARWSLHPGPNVACSDNAFLSHIEVGGGGPGSSSFLKWLGMGHTVRGGGKGFLEIWLVSIYTILGLGVRSRKYETISVWEGQKKIPRISHRCPKVEYVLAMYFCRTWGCMGGGEQPLFKIW